MAEASVLKIEFDRMTDFKFNVAYKAYSELFDEMTDTEKQRNLNEKISELHNQEIGYSRYYGEIERLRGNSEKRRKYYRARIKGQRKWAYNRAQQEKNRISRHK